MEDTFETFNQGACFLNPEDFVSQTDSATVMALTIENSQLHEQVRKLQADNLELSKKLKGIRQCCRKCRFKAQNQRGNSVNDISVANNDLLGIEETINQLFEELDIKNSSIQNIIASYEQKLENLSQINLESTAELLQQHEVEISTITTLITKEYEELIKDMLINCEGLFDELRADFVKAEENNPTLNTKNAGQMILTQFKNLGETTKGIAVTAICLISSATGGWISWNFIIWLWTRLINNLETIVKISGKVANIVHYSSVFVNSAPCKSFLKAWKDGKSLNVCLEEILGSSQLSSMMAMAPQIFSAIKKLTKNNPIRV